MHEHLFESVDIILKQRTSYDFDEVNIFLNQWSFEHVHIGLKN
jgi:hypothetical protein